MQANKTIGIVAPSGSGKTTVVASEIVAVSPCVAIYDPQAARDTQYRMAADHIIDDSDLNAFHRILAEPQFKVLFKPKDPIIEGNKADFTDFAQFIRKCYRRCELIGPMTLIVDEAHFTCADRSIPYDLLKVTTMARSVSLDTVWVTQKISGVNTWLRSNAHEYWFFRIVSERDLDIIAEICGNDVAEEVANLRRLDMHASPVAPGQLLKWSSLDGSVTIIDLNEVRNVKPIRTGVDHPQSERSEVSSSQEARSGAKPEILPGEPGSTV